jgi:polar amino acid transport system substrate-binding protein
MLNYMISIILLFCSCLANADAAPFHCSRPYTLALHEHGLLYSASIDAGIDKDIADELTRRSGCKITVTLMSRDRIWQLIEFAAFAWYLNNKYYLLVRNDAGVQSQSDFEKNQRLKLGVIRSFRYSASANQLVDKMQESERLSQAGGLEPLYQLLMNNIIQGMIIEPFDYPALQEKDIRKVTSIVEFNDPAVLHGLIMSRKALSSQEQEQWGSLINDMRKDGTMLSIFKKYFSPQLAATLVNF